MKKYSQTKKRILIDMHIGDWDEKFLSKFDTQSIAEKTISTGAEGVMMYFQSHLGLCYWPSKSGPVHGAMKGRDFAGDTFKELSKRDIPVCAYYSTGFNNWAWETKPEWRIVPVGEMAIGYLHAPRYGIVCINNEEYRDFVREQTNEILAYNPSAMFFDMVWWNGVCVCPSCREKYRKTKGKDLPQNVDWKDENWLEFQETRLDWLKEFTLFLYDIVKKHNKEIDVYHNFALGLYNWNRAVSFRTVEGHDFLGGDFYGNRQEQNFITRLMYNLTPKRPAEFMTTLTRDLRHHVLLRSEEEINFKIDAAVFADASFHGIMGINPDGTIDDELIKALRKAYERMGKFDLETTQSTYAEVAIYYSDSSRFNLNAQKVPLMESMRIADSPYQHFAASTGAARILTAKHVLFDVVTKKNLPEIAKYKVLILPDIQVMDDSEKQYFAEYAKNGGNIYASRTTIECFDLIGAKALGEENCAMVYVGSHNSEIIKRNLPINCGQGFATGAYKIATESAKPLAYFNHPYGYPHSGSKEDKQFSSIHCWPPFYETDKHAITMREIGKGKILYCAADLESNNEIAHDNLFFELISSLRGEAKFEIDAHPSLWFGAYKLEGNRYSVRFLNAFNDSPKPIMAGVKLRIKLEKGEQVTSAKFYGADSQIPVQTQNCFALIEIGDVANLKILELELG